MNSPGKLAGEVNDFATREVLASILQDEDKHIDEIEEVLDQVKQMGIQIFLATFVLPLLTGNRRHSTVFFAHNNSIR